MPSFTSILLRLLLLSTLSLTNPLAQIIPPDRDIDICTRTVGAFNSQLISVAFRSNSFLPYGPFIASQTGTRKPNTDVTVSNTDTILSFGGLDAAAFDCQLVVSFSPGYPGIFSTGNTLLNVYALRSPSRKNDTFATYFPIPFVKRGVPRGAYLFGTARIVAGERQVVGRPVCKETLTYLFEIATPRVEAAVYFWDVGRPGNGIFVTYNVC